MEKNNFNPIGNRPLAPTVYDENITPLESMNKLAYKINELIGDDTNVKEVVDRLLDVYKEHLMLKGGYCEELKCIAFENPLYAVVAPSTGKVVYKQTANVLLALSYEKGSPTFYQWQYKNDAGLFVDMKASGSNTNNCTVPITFYKDGDTKEFRCKLQNDMYTFYTSAFAITYDKPKGNITQTKNGKVNTYEQNQLSFNTDYPTDSDNVGWLWSTDNENWVEYGRRDVSIMPYYYVDKGTKTNGVSVGDSDKIYWKYQFKVSGSVFYSNTLITNVTKIDYDCGSATFNDEVNNNWDSSSNMILWYSYYKKYDTTKTLCDLSLSVNKNLNKDIITSVQWLYYSSSLAPKNKPEPTTLLTGATDITESITTELYKANYVTNNVLFFRLQVVVGNVAYYSDIVSVYAPLASINISQSPTGTLSLNSTVTLTATFNNYVPSTYDINNVIWYVSNNRNSWSQYSVYGSSNNIIKIKIYNDNAQHIDGYGVNGGTALYVMAIVNDNINNDKAISVKQS